jgi:ATP-dependent DNA helicase RecQ
MVNSTTDLTAAATAALRRLVGRDDADFRDGQLEAISALVADRSRVLVVQRTGWGKSAVYFVSTALRRAEGAGPTVIVSPLLALMRDQIAAAERAGIRAVTMNSANAQDWDEVRGALAADAVDVLLVSPERLNNPRFRDEQLPDLARRCGSARGRRGALRQRLGARLPPRLPAHPRPARRAPGRHPGAGDDRHRQRARGDVTSSSSSRSRAAPCSPCAAVWLVTSLRLGVLRSMSPEQRLGWLVAHLHELPGQRHRLHADRLRG